MEQTRYRPYKCRKTQVRDKAWKYAFVGARSSNPATRPDTQWASGFTHNTNAKRARCGSSLKKWISMEFCQISLKNLISSKFFHCLLWGFFEFSSSSFLLPTHLFHLILPHSSLKWKTREKTGTSLTLRLTLFFHFPSPQKNIVP